MLPLLLRAMKSCMTILATISMSGNKLLLFFLAKGETGCVEDFQIGDVGDHWRAHIPSGWMIADPFTDYLRSSAHMLEQIK
jgi:hypothetical protein